MKRALIAPARTRRWIWYAKAPEDLFEEVLMELLPFSVYAPSFMSFERLFVNVLSSRWLARDGRIPHPPFRMPA